MKTNNKFIESGKSERPLILGLCGSLRAGRWGKGTSLLVDEIKKLKSEEELKLFLRSESEQHLKNFIAAGREEYLPFDQIYKNLKKMPGIKGLSNSEVILSAALWEVYRHNCDIEVLSLSEYFSPFDESVDLKSLKNAVKKADGILISTPVYFGDRSSLVNSFIEMIQTDEELLQIVKGKIYAGLAVGAKRNGGQETTLIYQVIDMINSNFLAVGNDSETTSQYGGTCHAGDIGMAWKDEYGLWTSMGTGRRLAKVVNIARNSNNYFINDKLKVGFLITQDKNDFAYNRLETMMKSFSNSIEAKFFKLTQDDIYRCIACDICPTKIGTDEEYRCIINNKHDWFKKYHESLQNLDALVPVAYTSRSMKEITSVYQKFMERTRYLRRGDYVFSDLVVAPFTFEEIGSDSSLRLRMLTSTLRHHTIMSRPIVAFVHNGDIVNEEGINDEFRNFIEHINKLTVGRLVSAQEESMITKYNPVGYILSQAKDKEDEKLNNRMITVKKRIEKFKDEFQNRIIT